MAQQTDRAFIRTSPVPRPEKKLYEVRLGTPKPYNEQLGTWFVAGIVLALLLAAAFMLSPMAQAQTPEPSQRAQNANGAPISQLMIVGRTVEELQQQILARCQRRGWEITEQTPHATSCQSAANGMENWAYTTNSGAGRAPRWILRVQYVEAYPNSNPAQVVVSANFYMQAYTWTGGEGRRVTNRQSDQAAAQVLYDLQATCTQPCS